MNRESRILKPLLFLMLVVLFDQVTGQALRYLYFHQKTGQNHALTYLLTKCEADIVILGNSRAQHHYVSRILEDSLHMSCYNGGQDGGHSIIMQYAELKAITKRYSPKLVILEFNPADIVRFAGDYDRLAALLPYYRDSPEIRPMVLLRSPSERLKLNSAIYPFNSNLINSLRYNTNAHAAQKKDSNGYIPLYGEMKRSKGNKYQSLRAGALVDPNMVNSIRNIITLCNEKNISLLISCSPVFYANPNIKRQITASARLTLDIFAITKARFLDFSNIPEFAGYSQLFQDDMHMNNAGAIKFTNLLVKKISQDMKINKDT